jgi:hypothetical protein
MKRFATILAAGAILLSAQAAIADTCFVEENAPLKTFGFTNTNKNFREIVRNRLIVNAEAQARTTAWPRSTPSATVTCFNEVDSAPTLLQKLEVYRDSKTNEFKVRETGL